MRLYTRWYINERWVGALVVAHGQRTTDSMNAAGHGMAFVVEIF